MASIAQAESTQKPVGLGDPPGLEKIQSAGSNINLRASFPDLRASACNRHSAKLALFSVQRGYIFRHGNSRLAASNILRSL